MKLTKIAIALVAVLAMSAVMASAASALQYKSTSSPVMLHGVQPAGEANQHVFTVDKQAVKCNVAEFNKASQTTPANEITGIVATYSNCVAFGFVGATVNMGNCTYTFKAPTEVASMEFKSNVALACGATPAVVKSSIFGSECEVTVGQAGNENLSESTTHEITITQDYFWTTHITENITYTVVKDNGVCPLAGTGTRKTGSYNGNTEVEGTEGIGLSIG